MTPIVACRSCGWAQLEPVLSLGDMPLANSLLDRSEDIAERYPLDLVRCTRCDLVQITETIPPEILFREYSYFSSFSDTFVRHARSFATQMRERLDLGADSLVVEAASNDGYLLQFFAEERIPVLGIEPARNVANAATTRGIDTVPEFLDPELAESLVASHCRHADLVVANNVLAHVADLHGFVEGLRTLAGEQGLVSIEVPYVCEMVERLEFDTIYHEHLCYFSLTSVQRLLQEHGLSVVDVERLPVHGGSLRVLARSGSASPATAVTTLLEREDAWGVGGTERYVTFARDVEALRRSISTLMRRLAEAGERIAGYGAAAKAVVLMNACGLDDSVIEFVVDRNPYKQGKLLPGVRVPIYPPDALDETNLGYVLVFVWNIAAEVIQQQQRFADGGGKFIIPIPEPRVVGGPTASHDFRR